MEMDTQTLQHLYRWIERQFHPAQDQLIAIFAGMVKQYESDPEFYGARGWWKVWDDTPKQIRMAATLGNLPV